MNKPPAFQFYADDFLAGTCDMTVAEVGAYILLLCHQWSRGMIPSDSARVALIARGDVTPHVLSKFPEGKNARMEQERQKQAEYRAKQSSNGKASAKARLNDGSTTVQPPFNDGSTKPPTKLQPKPNSPSPSPSSSSTHTHGAAEDANIPTEQEVNNEADMRGIPPESAKSFFNHHQGNNLWINQYGRLIDWRTKLSGWATRDRKMAEVAKTPPKASGVDKINLGREYERVLKRIQEIRSAGDHLDMDERERRELVELKARKAELKQILGIKV